MKIADIELLPAMSAEEVATIIERAITGVISGVLYGNAKDGTTMAAGIDHDLNLYLRADGNFTAILRDGSTKVVVAIATVIMNEV